MLVVLVRFQSFLLPNAVREVVAGVGHLMPFHVFSEYILEGNNTGMGSACLSSQGRLNDLLHSLHLGTSFVCLTYLPL